MRTIAFLTALAIGAGAGAPPVAAENSAKPAALFANEKGAAPPYACFSRRYTKSHMGSHPQQNVTHMLAYVQKSPEGDSNDYTVSLGVSFRTLAQRFEVSGGCSLSDDGRGALDCGVECDGGSISVRIKDKKSILVEIPNGARVWDPANLSEDGQAPETARFGSDDKLFRVDRTDIKDCLPLVWDEEIKAQITAGK